MNFVGSTYSIKNIKLKEVKQSDFILWKTVKTVKLKNGFL